MKYKTRPVIKEAVQWTGTAESFNELLEFMGEYSRFGDLTRPSNSGDFKIKTLEGELTVSRGDFVIKGLKGEFYPCKPDIFEATYEAVH